MQPMQRAALNYRRERNDYTCTGTASVDKQFIDNSYGDRGRRIVLGLSAN